MGFIPGPKPVRTHWEINKSGFNVNALTLNCKVLIGGTQPCKTIGQPDLRMLAFFIQGTCVVGLMWCLRPV